MAVSGPIAVGGIGGSGTRVIARILQDLGLFIGTDLVDELDNLWYALLFGRRDALIEDNARFATLAALFFRQMSAPKPLNAGQIALLDGLCAQQRIQHPGDFLHGWARSMVRDGHSGRVSDAWGWKVPYTHMLIDRLLPLRPDLRYVHITRNGPDMAFSANQNQLLKWGPVLLCRDVVPGPRDALSYWVAVHRRMARLGRLYPDRIFHLDYDRLIRDPRAVLAGLLDFIGADPAPGQLDTFAARIIAPDTVDRHRTQDMSVFRPEDLEYIAQLETGAGTLRARGANRLGRGASQPLSLTGAEAAPDSTTALPPTGHRTGPQIVPQSPVPPAGGKPDAAQLESDILASRSLRAGHPHYRAYVGPPQHYDFMGATQFRLLTGLGLREEHRVLDIGCGSLRAGKFLLQYLLPRRYTGIDPNSWLWQDALQHEIGVDIATLKQPRFLDTPDFTPGDIGPEGMDFIVAQSVYSHMGAELFHRSVAASAAVLAPRGQMLFTVVQAGAPDTDKMQNGSEATGWIYPGCVLFDDDQVRAACAPVGLHPQRLQWYHPRQTWYRAVADPDDTLSAQMLADLGTGRPLCDPRFAPS